MTEATLWPFLAISKMLWWPEAEPSRAISTASFDEVGFSSYMDMRLEGENEGERRPWCVLLQSCGERRQST